MKTILSGLSPTEIAETLQLKPFQGRQVFGWLHGKRVFDFDAMTNLSKDLRARLKEEFLPVGTAVVRVQHSQDAPGTRKVLVQLHDGEHVEAVLIKDGERTTVCLSVQVGCSLGCAFCATGSAGFTRDLTAGEIVEQALHLLQQENLEGRTPNIVFMGMGEPFRNYDATMRSVALLMDSDGLGIGARRITVSTVGIVPGIRRFAGEGGQIRLSVSLHAANDALRAQLVPVNRQYPLADVRGALQDYCTQTRRQFTVEWTLLRDVNDAPQHAAELVRWLDGLKAAVNLIPYNPVEGLPYAPSSRAACRAFLQELVRHGIKATLRAERGGDIAAACGQLRQRAL